MNMSSGLRELRQLAALYGVQTAYYSVDHRRRPASAESLLAVVKGLGAEVNSVQDAASALLQKQISLWRRPLEPVTVAWEGDCAGVPVRIPRNTGSAACKATLKLEGGEWKSWDIRLADFPSAETADVDGMSYVVKQVSLSETLPRGYHRLALEIPGLGEHETLLISAPLQAYSPFAEGRPPTWGVFLPLYALHCNSKASPYGDFSDLRKFSDWTGQMGGGIVATLPILATFMDEPFEPSPYSPASRLLWNEFYVDLSRAPGLDQGEVDSLRRAFTPLRDDRLVDYKKGMAIKRKAMGKLARRFFDAPSSAHHELEAFLAKYPYVEDYARFRAVMEKQGTTWTAWPQRLSEGEIREGDYDRQARDYQVFAQWLAFQQVQELAEHGRESGVSLYLDLPLGVNSAGYDVWRRQDLFLREFAVGAPPDAFFTVGQNWGFPPVHPQNLRESGYDYYIAYLRHHLQTAGLLRIDHIMGLHRMFWIPQGMDGSQGVYVRYPAEESYAILTLESHRSQSAIVGEDLGTVPPVVRPNMKRHGIYSMYVAYFEMTGKPQQALNPIPSNVLASINTHDMPPFASFWKGYDINQRVDFKHQDESGAGRERTERSKLKKALIAFLQGKGLLGQDGDDPVAVLRALLTLLGRSDAPIVLGNLEDLWLEEMPQNIPGTGDEYPNWRQRARYSFEEFTQMPQVLQALSELDSQRKLAQNGR